MASALAAAPAAAQQERPLMVTAGTSITWDDNVFKLPDNATPGAGLGSSTRSDRYSATYVGLRFDRPYAQQRFVAEVSQTAYRYDRFSHLDFDALQYRAAWQWRLGPRVGGTLSADRSQSLVNYSDFRDTTQRNVRTAENRALSADAQIVGNWHLTAGLSQQVSRNSAVFLQERGFRASGGEAGVKYIAGSGSTAALIRRWLEGDYLERELDPGTLTDDGFERTDTEAVVSWAVAGRTTLEGRLARLDYRSNNFSQRDFSGTAARLGVRWTPSGRLSFNLAATRDVSPSSDAFRERHEDRLTLGGGWEFSARTTLRISVYRGESEFRHPVLPLAGAPRQDTLYGAQLGWDWRIHRNATITTSVQRQRRTSSDTAFAFHGTTATLGASLTF